MKPYFKAARKIHVPFRCPSRHTANRKFASLINRFAFSFFADEKKKQQPHVHQIRKDSPRRVKL